MSHQKEVTMLEAFKAFLQLGAVAGIVVAIVVGWVINGITVLTTMSGEPVTGEFILRVLGLFIFPLGSLMGYI